MSNDCTICLKKVYITEKIEANGRRYHKTCFKCSEKGCRLNITNFQSHDGHLFCQKHVPRLHAIIRQANTRSRSIKHNQRTHHRYQNEEDDDTI